MTAQKKVADNCVTIAQRLGNELDKLSFTTPSHVYNPLNYIFEAHRQYLEKFGKKQGRVLLLGMNPGPWGMAQTGVPFGEINIARHSFGIQAELTPPLPAQHDKYPLLGYDCTRSEGSGKRLWGWAEARFGSLEAFFDTFFVWNYCPLLFIANNRNLVPGKLTKAELQPVLELCNDALASVIDVTRPRALVGIGRWAEERAKNVVGDSLPVSYLFHPSPANPAANKNWPALAEEALAEWLD